MASMRDIKRRKESIQSTSQITKAMKLVSTVKLQKAKGRAEETKPYFNKMYETVSGMLARSGPAGYPGKKDKSDDGPVKKGVIVISSNRGLAGGYNSNIVKLITQGDFDPENTIIYPVGRKGLESLARQGYTCVGDFSEVINNPLFGDAVSIGKTVTGALESGEIDEVYLAYTVFKNTVSHIPTLIKLLPVSASEEELSSEDRLTMMNYEPGAEEALDMIIPKYLSSLVYGALIQAVASENGARMQAMDSATSNAEEMLDNLSLLYNRARQSSITQELTEIIAGAEAIS